MKTSGMSNYLPGGRGSLLGHIVELVDCPWHVGSRDAVRLLRACWGGVPYRRCLVEVDGRPCRPRRRRAEVTKPRGAPPVLAWAPNAGACETTMLGSREGRPLSVDVTKLIDKAPPMEWGGGTKAAPPNTTFRALLRFNPAFVRLHQHDDTYDGFASQLLAVGQGLHDAIALVSCRPSSLSQAACWRILWPRAGQRASLIQSRVCLASCPSPAFSP
jgi:hypothetical protein